MNNDNISRPFVTRNFKNFDELRRAFRQQVRDFHTTARRMGFREKASLNPLQDKTPVSPKIWNGIRLLRSQLTNLDNLIHQAKLGFPGDKSTGKLVVSAEDFRETLHKHYQKVENQLATFSRAKAPVSFKRTFKRLSAYLQEELAGRFQGQPEERIISLPVNGAKWTAGYLCFSDLRDSEDFVHNTYYLIVTSTENSNDSFHITLQPNFALPGTYSFDGSADSPKQLRQIIAEHLHSDKLVKVRSKPRAKALDELLRIANQPNGRQVSATTPPDKRLGKSKPKEISNALE